MGCFAVISAIKTNFFPPFDQSPHETLTRKRNAADADIASNWILGLTTMKAVGEGTLPSPVRAFAWSPAVDLCVFVLATEVSAHRLAGQRVWTISTHTLHAEDLEFTRLAWREDGTLTGECESL
jgi:hypothetical protein